MDVNMQPPPSGEQMSASKKESLVIAQLSRRVVDNQYKPTPEEYIVINNFANRTMRSFFLSAGATLGANYVVFNQFLRTTRAYQFRHVVGLSAAIVATNVFGSGDKRSYIQSVLQLPDSPMARETRIILNEVEGPNGPWYRQYGPKALVWDDPDTYAGSRAGDNAPISGLADAVRGRRQRRPLGESPDDFGSADTSAGSYAQGTGPQPQLARIPSREDRRGDYAGYDSMRERRPDAPPAQYGSEAGVLGGGAAGNMYEKAPAGSGARLPQKAPAFDSEGFSLDAVERPDAGDAGMRSFEGRGGGTPRYADVDAGGSDRLEGDYDSAVSAAHRRAELRRNRRERSRQPYGERYDEMDQEEDPADTDPYARDTDRWR